MSNKLSILFFKSIFVFSICSNIFFSSVIFAAHSVYDHTHVNQNEVVNAQGLVSAADPYIWDIGANGNGIDILVIDTGARASHIELNGGKTTCVRDFDGAGCSDGAPGNGHGTAIAAIAAADGSEGDIIGFAPDSNINVIKLQLTAGVTGKVDFANNLNSLNNGDWSASEVIVMSTNINYSTTPADTALRNNICGKINEFLNAGKIVVLSAGNDSSEIVPLGGLGNPTNYPSYCEVSHLNAANNNKLFVVGATNSAFNARKSDSSYGAVVDLYAPGESVWSATRTNDTDENNFNGTSFAAPMVAGAAAQLLSCGIAANDIKTHLQNGSTVNIAQPAGGNRKRLDVRGALANANTAPSALNLQNYNMPPNNIPLNQTLPNGTVVLVGGLAIGQLLATDSDTCDSHIYEVVAADPELSLLDHDADGVVDDIVLDEGTYNTATTFSITVRARDFFGELSANIVITVEIEAPVGPTPPILDVVLVMDRSGSMSWASAGVGTRMDVLQTATNAFADYLNMLSDNVRLGLIQFNATADEIPPAPAAEIFPFQVLVDDPDLSIANIDEAHAAINSLMPVGGTNIVEGVQDAAAILNPLADPSPRQAIVLLTDGLHNVPTPLDETTATTLSSELTSAIASPSTVFYSMGLGTEATINSDSLSATALAQSGVHLDEPDPPSMAMKLTWFANEIVEGAMVFDPIIELKLNELGKLDVPVTYADSSVRFAIFWTYANAENIVTRINTPSGACVIESEDSGAQFAQAKGKKYRIINVDLPFICKGKLEHGGVWSVDMLASSGSTSGPVLTHTGTTTPTSERFEQERFAVSAYTTSDVKLAAEGSSKHKYVNFDAALSGIAGSDLKNVKYTAYIKTPIDSNKLIKGDDDLSPEQQVQQQQILRDLLAQQKTIVVDMKSESANFASLSIVAKRAGVYQVRIVMEGIDKAGFTYRREANTSIYHDYKSNKARYIIICILLVLLLLICIRLFISWRSKAAYKL